VDVDVDVDGVRRWGGWIVKALMVPSVRMRAKFLNFILLIDWKVVMVLYVGVCVMRSRKCSMLMPMMSKRSALLGFGFVEER